MGIEIGDKIRITNLNNANQGKIAVITRKGKTGGYYAELNGKELYLPFGYELEKLVIRKEVIFEMPEKNPLFVVLSMVAILIATIYMAALCLTVYHDLVNHDSSRILTLLWFIVNNLVTLAVAINYLAKAAT